MPCNLILYYAIYFFSDLNEGLPSIKRNLQLFIEGNQIFSKKEISPFSAFLEVILVLPGSDPDLI
jgi:hypothetical protein